MSRFVKKTIRKKGLPAGTLVPVSEKKLDKARIRIIDYDVGNLEEREVDSVEDCFPFKDKPSVTWINIDGLTDMDVIEKLGKHFDVHPLVLEDIVSTGQRPKLEDFESHVFIVCKMLSYDDVGKEANAEQLSLLLGENYVISFQERVGDVFEHVRERIRKANGRIRKHGSDYLAYSLLDAVVDNYFTVLEKLGEKVEGMDDDVLNNPVPETLQHIHKLKADMVFIRKSIWPLRDVLSSLSKLDSYLIKESTGIYIRDVYDHTVQVMDSVEALKDMSGGLLDTYLSSVSNQMTEVSNRMNEVMKFLTIFASIFIPLTFIAGVYGMNFDYMPELKWRYGYFMVWGVMLVLGITMLAYFRRRKWI